jgi:hypothetical protein
MIGGSNVLRLHSRYTHFLEAETDQFLDTRLQNSESTYPSVPHVSKHLSAFPIQKARFSIAQISFRPTTRKEIFAASETYKRT